MPYIPGSLWLASQSSRCSCRALSKDAVVSVGAESGASPVPSPTLVLVHSPSAGEQAPPGALGGWRIRAAGARWGQKYDTSRCGVCRASPRSAVGGIVMLGGQWPGTPIWTLQASPVLSGPSVSLESLKRRPARVHRSLHLQDHGLLEAVLTTEALTCGRLYFRRGARRAAHAPPHLSRDALSCPLSPPETGMHRAAGGVNGFGRMDWVRPLGAQSQNWEAHDTQMRVRPALGEA